MSGENCVFCNLEGFKERVIFSDELVTSLVSKPWFRTGHVLVIPNRHMVTLDELCDDERVGIMQELGRLLVLLDEGFGTGIMQKYQPLQTENGIKVNHLHFHIFPREENEDNLFPTPTPNSFDGFWDPTPDKIMQTVVRLRKPAPLPDCNPI